MRERDVQRLRHALRLWRKLRWRPTGTWMLNRFAPGSGVQFEKPDWYYTSLAEDMGAETLAVAEFCPEGR